MINYFEYVSLGHTDKLCDYITSYILDKCIEQDKFVDYKVEVTILESKIILTGHIYGKVELDQETLRTYIRTALAEVGYNQYYCKAWSGLSINIQDLEIISFLHIGDRPGLEDNRFHGAGAYFGMATRYSEDSYVPSGYYFSKQVIDWSMDFINFHYKSIGIYIKTLVQERLDGTIDLVYLTLPIRTDLEIGRETLAGYQKHLTSKWPDISFVIKPILNHAGSGMTGRKLGVDFYGGYIGINGGSPWGKDPRNSDLVFNLWARKLALDRIKYYEDIDTLLCTVYFDGINQATITYSSGAGDIITSERKTVYNRDLAEKMGLLTPIYRSLVRNGIVLSKI